jgi:hypothetical protein
MIKYTCIGRDCILVSRKVMKIFSGYYLTSLPLNSKIRKFLFRVSRFGFWLKCRWFKLIGREIFPTFEIVNNPTIKLSEIKNRRFFIKENNHGKHSNTD